MKPFDLEAAKRGEPIISRAGVPHKFIAHVPEATEINRVVTLTSGGDIRVNMENGTISVNAQSTNDLFMATKKRTIYLNLYRDGTTAVHTSSLEDANRYAFPGRIGGKAWPLEIED